MTRIVGVVEDVRFNSLAAADESAYYLPANQAGQPNGPYQARYPMVRPAIVVAASNGNATALIGPLRDELRRFDAQLVVRFTTAEATMAAATSRQDLGMALMMVFGAMALCWRRLASTASSPMARSSAAWSWRHGWRSAQRRVISSR